MANPVHLAKLKEGVTKWNRWRLAQPDLNPDLSETELRGANLHWVDFHWTDLTGADLGNAHLRWANLRWVNLYGANLRRVTLSEADLEQARLTRANLTGADLRGVNLKGATLSASDLTGAMLGNTLLPDNDLSETKGLEDVQHSGPSMIGIYTIYKSQGKIPLSFLRGCGVPENLITYIPSLVAPGAIQFYSCFISYSTKDQEFADRLYADLQNKGVRCWFAPHDVQGGKKLHEQIDDAIRCHERLLLILSPNSMASKWVKTEIRNARKREVAEKKRVLFPVRLASYEALRDWELFDADEGEDLATEIREYYIPDFSEWKNHDSYAREFERLLRDLRTEEANAK